MPIVVLIVSQSRYSDGLQAGRPEFHSRQRQEIFLRYAASRPALGPTYPMGTGGYFSGGEAAEA
jgi:hypothetical protein